MSKVNYIVGTQALFNAIATKDANALYFITDTQRIYKGNVDFTQNVFLVDNFPANGVDNKIYIHKNTGEVQVYHDGSWQAVNPGYVQTIESLKDAANGGKLATVNAIKGYIDEMINGGTSALFQDVGWNKEQGKIQFKGADGTTVLKESQLEGVSHDATYDATALRITIPQYGKDDLVIDLPKDNFLSDAYFEKDYTWTDGSVSPAIVLVVNTGNDELKKIPVPAAAMTNDYTAGKTSTIQVSIDDSHKIKARLIIDTNTSDGVMMIYDSTTGKVGTNGIKIENDPSADLCKCNKCIPTAAVVAAAIKRAVGEVTSSLLAEGNADEVVISTTNGIVRSGVKIGGATLSEMASATTLATEAAVLEAISWKVLA